METVYPRSVVHDLATQAAKAGVPALRALPFPVGSQAGQLFLREHAAAMAFERAKLPAGVVRAAPGYVG